MLQCDYEIEKYVVYYQENGKKRELDFDEEDRAITYAKEKMNRGVDVNIIQIVNLIGWY